MIPPSLKFQDEFLDQKFVMPAAFRQRPFFGIFAVGLTLTLEKGRQLRATDETHATIDAFAGDLDAVPALHFHDPVFLRAHLVYSSVPNHNGKRFLMDVLILSRKPDVPSVGRLFEEFRKAGHTSVILEPEDENIKKTPCDLIIPRLGSFRFEESLVLLDWHDRRGTPILNRPQGLRDARSKWISYLILREEDLPLPESRSLAKPALPRQFPYVVKQMDLSRGEGVFLLRSAEDLMALPPEPEWIWQEYIGESQGEDHRLLVTPDRLIGAMKRQAKPGEFRSNLAQGGSAVAYTPTSLEIDIACKAAKALNLDIAGVDLIPSRRGPLILEVNGCPGFDGLEKATEQNIAKAYVEWAEARIEGAE